MSIPVPPFMSERLRCCVCSNSEINGFSLRYQKENYAVVRCDTCGFLFIPPYYRQKIDYGQYKNEDVTRAVRGGNNWVKVQRHRLRFRFIRKYVRKGMLFDLGAGWGHFLLAGKELGFDVYGIEISEQPYLFCVEDLGLPVDHIDFFSLSEERKFDVITMWDVLEHIDRADDFIAKCARQTLPGGYLFLQVPQIDSFIAKRKKGDWKMMGLDHVNYFSKDTIRRLLERYGYEVLEIKSSFEIKLFLMYTVLPWLRRLRNKSKISLQQENAKISAAERQQYFNAVTTRPIWQLKIAVGAHNLLYNLLSVLGIGEEMMVAARKKR